VGTALAQLDVDRAGACGLVGIEGIDRSVSTVSGNYEDGIVRGRYPKPRRQNMSGSDVVFATASS
jgi:hypothetical protein